MSDTDLPVSEPEAFYAPMERVALPVKSIAGATLVVEVRGVDPLVILEAMECLPGFGGQPDDTLTDLERAKAMAGPMRTICKAGLAAPLLKWDGEGEPRWESIALPNRMAIFEAIMRLSGFGEVPGAAGPFPEGAPQQG